jgi:hypothetical protein
VFTFWHVLPKKSGYPVAPPLILTAGSTPHARGCSATLTDLHAFDKQLRSAYSVCGLVSLVFLSITLFFYLTLPKLRNHQVLVLTITIFSIYL